jgi:hypothetical protein
MTSSQPQQEDKSASSLLVQALKTPARETLLSHLQGPHCTRIIEALGIVDRLASTASHVGQSSLSNLTPLSAAVEDEGAIVIEWIAASRRLGVSLEVDDSESGWYYVHSPVDSTSGLLPDFDYERTVAAFVQGITLKPQ